MIIPHGKTLADLEKQGMCHGCNTAIFGFARIERALCCVCMEELYLERKFTLRDIALRAGVSMQRVHQILTENKVKMRRAA